MAQPDQVGLVLQILEKCCVTPPRPHMSALTRDEAEALYGAACAAGRQSMEAFAMLVRPQYADTWAPYHSKICDALDRVAAGDCRRLIVTLPPGHGKSEFCSVLLPAYMIGRQRNAKVIVTAYGATLVELASRRCMEVVESQGYRSVFPGVQLNERAKAASLWEVVGGGRYLAAGMSGSITGHRADLIVVDDPHSNKSEAESETVQRTVWDLFTGSLQTRLYPGGRIVVIMTRWSPGDLVGRILESDGAEEWEVLHLPALSEENEPLWPKMYDRGYLEERRATDPHTFEALYQGRPYIRGGNYLRREWFKYSEVEPEGVTWHRGIDLAVSAKRRADFTASVRVAMKEGVMWIAGGWFHRAEWPTSKRKIVAVADAETSILHVEGVIGFDIAVRELMEELRGRRVVNAVNVKADKLTRALPWIALAEAGRVVLVRRPGGADDVWLNEFMAEADTFPGGGRHDDLIDAVTLGYHGAAVGEGVVSSRAWRR